MVHATDAVPVVEGAGDQVWQPGLGGLPLLENPFGGPSSGLIVNLATGNLTYLPKPDMDGFNKEGSGAVFARSYRSELALRGYGSPGLPAGWVHTWDVTLIRRDPNKPNSDMALIYPSGAGDGFRPQIGADGKPTGKFEQGGRPFLLTGFPSATVSGGWEKFTLLWQGNTQWTFTLGPDHKTYVLRQINDLLLDWDDTQRIRSVRSAQRPKEFLLTFEYRPTDGMLLSVTDATDARQRRVSYLYSVPPPALGLGTAPVMSAVSQLYLAREKMPDVFKQTYAYTGVNGKGILNKVSVPNNGGYTTATVVYRNQKVGEMVDANDNRRIYTYLPTGTRVEVWGKTDTRPLTFRTENIDPQGRHTGTTDALGHSTKLGYGDK